MSKRRNRLLPWIAAAVGLLIGLILIVVASQVSDAPSSAKRTPRIVDAKDIPKPEALTSDESQSTTKVLQADQISLQSGAWVQVADDKGRLEQQYHATRIDPEPDKWLRMQSPQAVMFPSGGRIVTISSRGALGGTRFAHYVASKSAVVGLTRAMAMELRDKEIAVNSVAPGFTDTPMTRSAPPEMFAQWEALEPRGKAASPDEIAHAVSFLASPQTHFITGQTLFVDGGKSLGGLSI